MTKNFLANVPYSQLKKVDYNNKDFICNLYVLLAQNTNHFSLERKFQSLHGEQIVQFVGKKVCQKFLQIYMPVGRVLHT